MKTTDGTHFLAQSNPSTSGLVGVSCPTPANCFAVQSGGIVLTTSDGNTWTVVPGTSTTLGTISGLSCTNATHCEAVGSAFTPNAVSGYGLVYGTQNGTTWAGQVVHTAGKLTAVSCSATTTCDAVSSSGEVIRTLDGGTWSPALPAPLSEKFTGIACPAGLMCYAVAKVGGIVQIGAAPGH
jgi:hypothetical protein